MYILGTCITCNKCRSGGESNPKCYFLRKQRARNRVRDNVTEKATSPSVFEGLGWEKELGRPTIELVEILERPGSEAVDSVPRPASSNAPTTVDTKTNILRRKPGLLAGG